MIQISLERKITFKEVKIKTAVDFPTALLDAQAFEKETVFILKFYTHPLMKNSFFFLIQSCKDSKLNLPHTLSQEVIGRRAQQSKDINLEKEKNRTEEKVNPKNEAPRRQPCIRSTAYPVQFRAREKGPLTTENGDSGHPVIMPHLKI